MSRGSVMPSSSSHREACVGLEGGAHLAMGVVQSGTDRPRRDAERLGDLGRLESDVVAQDEDRALFRPESPEATFEKVAPGHGLGGVGGHRCDGGIEWHQMDRGAARRARELETDADQDPRRPGLEPVGLAQARQFAPRDDERPLDGVVGEIDVAEDPSRDPEQAVPMRPDQDREGVLVTALGQLHEVVIHPGHR